MANILYFGPSSESSTAAQRANALKRLGHSVETKDPYKAFDKALSSWAGYVHYRTGYRLIQGAVAKYLETTLRTLEQRPDLIWVDLGELFGPDCLKILKTANCPIVCYNIDDPTGGRDGSRYLSFIKSIPLYDVIAVMRSDTANECRALGGKQVLQVFMSYDEEVHKPYPSLTEIPSEFKSEVVFVGTWMRHEKRDNFLLTLKERGVPITIWGNRWQKSPHFEKLKTNWRGRALYGREYVAAIQGSKICIGMLSKGNRDLHTTRSLEIPFAGGLFCGQRTSEHLELYRENIEAIFWSDAEECAARCNQLLSDEPLREKIRQAGMERIRTLKLGNEDTCGRILTIGLK